MSRYTGPGLRILEPTAGAIVLLIGCVTLSCRALHAQVDHDPQLLQQKAQEALVCVDPARPASDRLRSCTELMDRPGLAKSARAAILVQRADALNALGKRDEAIADLTKAIGIEPASGMALYNRGLAYQRNGELDKALADFHSAAHLLPPFAPAQAALEILREADTATAAENAHICADAAQPPAARVARCTLVLKLKQAVLADSERAHVLGNRANALIALGKRDDALADLSGALTLNPRDEIALASRATLYMDTNRPDLAETDLFKLKLINPTNGTTFYNAGVADQRVGDFAKALDDYRTAVRLLPSFAPAHAALGVLLKAQDPNAALAEFNQALALDAQSPALKSRASLNLSLGQREAAIHDFDALIARDSSDSLAYLNRGVAKEQLGDLESALEDYDRSIAVAPSASAHFDRANLYLQLDQPQKAIADFTAALALDPKNIKALIGRADVNYGARRLAESREDYTRVIESQPENADAFFKRGSVYFDMGDFAAAYRDYSVSLALDPKQPDVLRNRALAAERMGTARDAEKDRQRARADEP